MRREPGGDLSATRTGGGVTRAPARQAITPEALAPLIERFGERWNIWPSAQGVYACATLRRGLRWVDSSGRHPVGAGGAYVQSLIAESLDELEEAIGQENDVIGHLLAEGTLETAR